MLKHIVMFKLKENYLGKPKNELAREIKASLEKLPSLIPQIKFYEIGINELSDPRSFDLVLISIFENKDDLELYRNHPEHKKTLEFILERSLDAKVVDYFV
ncbi:MAG: Dabb family protein [Ignavibacteria bacterium]|nr:Dabb family protein [Ignavibacteria bacterium]